MRLKALTYVLFKSQTCVATDCFVCRAFYVLKILGYSEGYTCKAKDPTLQVSALSPEAVMAALCHFMFFFPTCPFLFPCLYDMFVMGGISIPIFTQDVS
jgi:hypothetical protein